MGKSSASRKKDRSKTSSSSQRSRRKSRSRKLKSKKLRRRNDSPSYSDSDLESSTSASSSSSEGDNRKGRSRSGMQKDVRAGKRRARKRSHNRQSRDYSPPHGKKRKHSKKDDDLEVKKTYKKKKRRRDVSFSAISSDSLSCSTCQDGRSSSNESEVDRHRGQSGKRKRNLGKTECRHRSKSRSPCSICSRGSDYQIEDEDNSFVENNCRRLRSVIVVVGEQHKLEEFSGDQQQKEVKYHSDDDQPSFKNMDGNDGASERESNHVASKEASKVENEKEVCVLDVRNCVDVVKDHEILKKGRSDNHGGVINDYSVNDRKNECPGKIDNVNGTDMESILRQRALENLRKFKSVPPKNIETPAKQKVDLDNDAKQLYSSVSNSDYVEFRRDNAEVNGVEFSEQDGESVVNPMVSEDNGVEFSEQDGESVVNPMVSEDNGVKSSGVIDLAVANMQHSIYSSQYSGNISDGDYSKRDCTSLDQEVVNDNSDQKANAVICSTTNRSNLVIAASRPRSKVDFPIKQASTCLESIQEKPSTSDVNVNETAQFLDKTTNDDDQNTGNVIGSSAPKPSSSLKSTSGGNSASEEASQFEQKTMSVMRGGEMVQVNYKVYIPKRAPALTRRHLKR